MVSKALGALAIAAMIAAIAISGVHAQPADGLGPWAAAPGVPYQRVDIPNGGMLVVSDGHPGWIPKCEEPTRLGDGVTRQQQADAYRACVSTEAKAAADWLADQVRRDAAAASPDPQPREAPSPSPDRR